MAAVGNRHCLLGDVFRPIISLLGMLNGVPLVTLLESVAECIGDSIADCDPSNLPAGFVLPSRAELATLCKVVLEMAEVSPLLKKLPQTVDGIDRINLVGALILYTMEEPCAVYRLISQPLNVNGVRSKAQLSCQLRYLKLLSVALRLVPKDSEYWFSGVVYRGVSIDGNPILQAKYDDYKTAFAQGTRITFAAPTSTTTNDEIAAYFAKGIQYVIQGDRPDNGPGGVMLKSGDLSIYNEDEVLLAAPMTFEVVAALKVENTVVVVMQVALSIMRSACFLCPLIRIWSQTKQSNMSYLTESGALPDATGRSVALAAVSPPSAPIQERLSWL